MTGIIIIFYNEPEFLIHQHRLIKQFCKDEYEFICIDNSSDEKASDAIKYHAQGLGVRYVRSNASSRNGSDSHAFAASLSYNMFKDRFERLLYLDHDCFPVKEFSVKDILSHNNILAGIEQVRNDRKYLWPGCLAISNKVTVDWLMVRGLDTGGGTWKIIEQWPYAIKYFDEKYEQNPGFTKSNYDFYSLLNEGTFMHFINGSNWAASPFNRERINSLLNLLPA